MRSPVSVITACALRSIALTGVPSVRRTPLPETPFGPAIGASWGIAFPVRHAFGRRRFFVAPLPLVAEQDDLGGSVLLLGRQRRRDASRPAADNDDLAHRIHPPTPFRARCRELLTRPRHCA